MQLISKDFNFNGKHAIMVDKLLQSGLFEYLWQIFVSAPLIGYIYKRKGEPDTGEKKTIFLSQLSPRYDEIYFIYKLILLADDINEVSPGKRIEKAFLNIGTELAKSDEELFHRYLLGGVEVLYEKIIKNDTELEKILENLEGFIKELCIDNSKIIEEYGIEI